MWFFPLAAAVVALVFAFLLAQQFWARRRPYQALWAVAMAMFAIASFMVFLGVLGSWTPGEFKAYWLLGAVLTVPYLAQGEIYLLLRRRQLASILFLALLFGTAFAMSRIRSAHVDPTALARDLPSGSKAFGSDDFALALARFYSYPSFVMLVAGTLWSALRMRGRPELRDRFGGTLGIAIGASIVAAGSAFAASGNATGFSLTLTAGVAAMFWGFLRASRAPRETVPPSA
jgi:hypothetical protein